MATTILSHFRAILPAFLVSRILVLVVALAIDAASAVGADRPAVMPEGAPLAILTASWDSIWYARVAADGYSTSPDTSRYQDYAYLPLLPASEWVLANASGLSELPWGYNIAGVLLSHTFFFAALALLYAFALRLGFSTFAATSFTWLLCALPWSFIFSTGYSESLFLLLAAAALLAGYDATLRLLREERPRTKLALLAGLLAGLAAITRAQGMTVAAAVSCMLVAGIVLGRSRSVDRIGNSHALLWRAGIPALTITPAFLLLGGFIAYIGVRTGNPTAAMTIRTAWGTGWLGDLGYLAAGPFRDNGLRMGEWLSFTSLLIWGMLLVVTVRYFGSWLRNGLLSDRARLESPVFTLGAGRPSGSSYTSTKTDVYNTTPRAAVAVGLLVYVIGYFVVSVVTNVGNGGWGRYLIVSFPIVWAAGSFIRTDRTRFYVVVVFLSCQALLLAAMVLKHYVP